MLLNSEKCCSRHITSSKCKDVVSSWTSFRRVESWARGCKRCSTSSAKIRLPRPCRKVLSCCKFSIWLSICSITSTVPSAGKGEGRPNKKNFSMHFLMSKIENYRGARASKACMISLCWLMKTFILLINCRRSTIPFSFNYSS